MRIFIRVAERGSFSAVARELGLSQSAISKAIGALEGALSTRLVSRSTRSVSLTEAGRTYHVRCRRILADVEDADASLASLHSTATGTLRVAAPVPFGLMFISARLARFKTQHSALSVDLNLDDQALNLVEHDIDVAIRLGHLRSPGLTARKLGSSPFICVAAPDYLAVHGLPKSPEDLARHNCISYSKLEKPQEWNFLEPKKVVVSGNYQCNNLLAIRDAAGAGIGIARLPLWMVEPEIKSGALQAVLTNYPPPPFDIHAVFPSAKRIPTKTTLFVDFIRRELQSVSYFFTAKR